MSKIVIVIDNIEDAWDYKGLSQKAVDEELSLIKEAVKQHIMFTGDVTVNLVKTTSIKKSVVFQNNILWSDLKSLNLQDKDMLTFDVSGDLISIDVWKK